MEMVQRGKVMTYYQCPTIGSGTDTDPYRPKIANYDCSWSCVYAEPGESTSIVAVNAMPDVLAQINSDSQITVVTDLSQYGILPQVY